MIWEARIVPRVGIVRRLWPTPGRTETGQIERALARVFLSPRRATQSRSPTKYHPFYPYQASGENLP